MHLLDTLLKKIHQVQLSMVHVLGETSSHCKKVQKIFSRLQKHSNEYNPMRSGNL